MIRCRLFLGSYAALWFLLALRFTNLSLWLTMLVLGVIGLVDTVRLVVLQPRRLSPSPYEVASVSDHGSEVAGYLATYLLPFLVVGEPGARDLGAYGLFLIILAVIFVQSGLTEVNPTLYLLRRRVSRIRTAEGWEGFAITRHRLEAGDHLRAVHLDDGVLMEVP